MSNDSDNYYSWSSGKNIETASILEVAVGSQSIVNYSSGTKFKNYTTVNTWTVEGLNTLGEGTTRVESPTFTHQNSSRWCMVLTKNSDGLHLSFMLINSGATKHLVAYIKANEILQTGEKQKVFSGNCSLMKGETKLTLIRKSDTADEDDDEGDEDDEDYSGDDTGDDEDEGGGDDDKITLQCEVTMQCIVQNEVSVTDTAETHASIVRNLDEMFHKEILTDFELRTGGTVLKAHRALLSVRSPYFAAMLQPHTKEAQDGFVQVSDVKPKILKQILVYMYTGVAPALEDMPWDLLIAADKYQLQQLKRQCEAHIASRLSVDNATETAASASVFSCDLLWDRAIVFIKKNLSQVMHTPGWANTIVSHPETIQRISELI